MGRLRALTRSIAANVSDSWQSWDGWDPMGPGGAMLNSRRTKAGVTVNAENALTVPAFFAAIRNLAEDVASQPWLVCRPGDQERAHGTAFWTLLHDAPNYEMSSMSFRELLVSFALTTGAGMAEIERDGAGKPVALWPLHPSRVRVVREGGEAFIVVRGEPGEDPVALGLDDVFIVHGLGSDGITGYSVVRLMSESLGIAMAAQEYGAAMFGNDTSLGVIFTTAGEMSEPSYRRFRRSVREHAGGPRHAHKPFIAEGVDVKRLGLPPKDAQMIEARLFQVHDLARAVRMPLSMLGEPEPYASIEQMGIRYATFTLRPWCVRLEQEAQRKILPAGWTSEVLLDGLMRGDFTTRTNGVRTQVSTAVLTPNEGRAKMGHPRIDRPEADMLWMQGAMAPIERLAAAPAPPVAPPTPPPQSEPQPPPTPETPPASEPAQEQDARALRVEPLLRDVAQRVVGKETLASARAWKKHDDDVRGFASWARVFYESQRAFLLGAMAPVLDALGFDDSPRWVVDAAGESVRRAGSAAVQAFTSGRPIDPEPERVNALLEVLHAYLGHPD